MVDSTTWFLKSKQLSSSYSSVKTEFWCLIAILRFIGYVSTIVVYHSHLMQRGFYGLS